MTKVLVVDDSEAEIVLITELLSDMKVESAHDGIEALEKIAFTADIDVILLDLYMPRLDGFGVLEQLRKQENIPPIIIFTNADDVEHEIKGLNLGAVDFVRKPVNRTALHKRIEIQLALQESARITQDRNNYLQMQVEQRTNEALRASEIAIHSLIQLLEVRNIETSNHAKRSSNMMELLCNALQKSPQPGYELTDFMIHELVRTAPLHDIGKVGIPDSILLKPGRLMAIIDVYDALTSNRVYKKAISHEEALKIIQEERGAHFDPVITEVFVSISDSIREISKQKR